MESEDKKHSRDIFSKDISGEENRNGRWLRLSTTIFNQFQVFHTRGDLSSKYRQLCRESTVDYVFNQERGGEVAVA